MQIHSIQPMPGEIAGPAVLELGADVGAAVIYAEAALDGAEIEIRPSGGAWDGSHTAVRRRPCGRTDDSTLCAAVFWGLRAGPYDLRIRGTSPPTRSALIQVSGGQVTEHTLAVLNERPPHTSATS
jgi:hypothetical protein